VSRVRVALTGLLLASACLGAENERPRHVLFVSLDTLRPDFLACYGAERETSPAIDALAAAGVRFADASSPAPWTLPSHTTMFTGLYPSHHGVKDYAHRLPEEHATLAEVLRARGFETRAVINTWNLANPSYGIFQGFEPEDVTYIREAKKNPAGGEVILNTGRAVLDSVKDFLATRDESKSFFLFAHFYDAHTDFTPDPEFRAEFVAPYAGKLDGTTGQLFAIRDQGFRLPEKDLAFLRQLYMAEIRQLDELVGELVAELERRDLLDETLIVLTSDHGEEFQEHGGLLHGRTQYQELLSVPLILRGPGLPAGAVIDAPVGLIDLYPTVLGALGLAAPGAVDGVDLAPLWRGGTLAPRALFGEADHNNVVDGKPVLDIKRSVRVGDDKLHLDRARDAVQLYTLGEDPFEQLDRTKEEPARAAFLRAELARFLAGEKSALASGHEMSAEEEALLEQLGYGGGASDK
jgi:arylsulfatase A-like enzyme